MVPAEVGVPEVGDEDSLEAMVSSVVSPVVSPEVAVAGDEDSLVRDVSRVDTEVSTPQMSSYKYQNTILFRLTLSWWLFSLHPTPQRPASACGLL